MEINIDIAGLRKSGIYIMAPVYDGKNHTSFTRSMMDLSVKCALYGINLNTYFTVSESLVQRARNYCADSFLSATFPYKENNDTEAVTKHFDIGIFIDSDIGFVPDDVLVLAHHALQEKKGDVVCGPYPRKTIAWEKVKVAVDRGLGDNDPNNLAEFAGDFVLTLLPGTQSFRTDQPVQVMESGTGFMAFHRDLLIDFIEKYPEQRYLPDHVRTVTFDGSREITAFFDTGIDPKSRRYLSEDYFFCQYVRNMGRSIWVLPWIRLEHTGNHVYSGSIPAMAIIEEDIGAGKKVVKQ